jgi:hypothetical protein
MKFAKATNFNRKSGEAEGSAVHSAFATKVRGKNEFVIPTGANPDFLPHCAGENRVCAFP